MVIRAALIDKISHRNGKKMPRIDLFPVTTTIHTSENDSYLKIAGIGLHDLVEKFGTPLYLYDRVTLDQAVDSYRNALSKAYPAEFGLTYAGKAFLCKAIASWSYIQNLWIDCTGVGEIYIAKSAGVPNSHIVVHGVNKSLEDIEMARNYAGTIVLDNLDEINRLKEEYKNSKRLPDLWLRIRPGVTVDTHAFRQTGQSESKFGLGVEEALHAVQECVNHNLLVNGLHFHLGSHFHDPAPVKPAIYTVLGLVKDLRERFGVDIKVISPGGGWGTAYSEDDLPHKTVEDYVSFVCQQLIEACEAMNLPLPRLQLEPGRSLVARAGVALYRVGGIKKTPIRRWILVDGGMVDNPRFALYGARYSCLPVINPNRPYFGSAWIGGPYCESGDVLIENIPMPEINVGELIAVPVSGAYHLSMSSNYNGARKPAVVWLENGEARLIQRRETVDDLIRRDLDL